jgi:hypothetical protein
MTLLKQTKYLNYTDLPSKGKTKIIGVGNNQGMKLAYIKWEPHWRRYVLHPMHFTVYDASCLSDITDFITQLMAERKTNAKKIRCFRSTHR